MIKNRAAANTESIVFIIENQTTRRMLKMFLAAVGLDARTYSSSREFQALHDTARIRFLVLDMQLPGMDGAILQRQETVDQNQNDENSETFKLIPIINKSSRKSILSSRFTFGDAMLKRAEKSYGDIEGWE